MQLGAFPFLCDLRLCGAQSSPHGKIRLGQVEGEALFIFSHKAPVFALSALLRAPLKELSRKGAENGPLAALSHLSHSPLHKAREMILVLFAGFIFTELGFC